MNGVDDKNKKAFPYLEGLKVKRVRSRCLGLYYSLVFTNVSKAFTKVEIIKVS